MKFKIGGLILGSLIVGMAFAQTEKPAEEGLILLKHDLRRAANEMAPCLPIYQGHCGKAKDAVREARVIIDSLITPAAVAATPAKAEVKKELKPVEPAKEASKKTKLIEPVKPTVKEAPKVEAPKLTEAEKITRSQTKLRKGLEEIEKTIKDLKASANLITDAEKAAKLEKLLQTAEEEAKIAISLHEKEG